MGIRGLLRWLKERHNIGVRHAHQPLANLITAERDTLVIDADSWAIGMHASTDSVMDTCAGGNWLLLYQRIERFLEVLAAMNAKAVFIFDSVRPQRKRVARRARRWQASVAMWGVQRRCCETVHTDYWHCQRLLDAVQRASRVPTHLPEVAGAILAHLSTRFAVEVYDAAPGVDADLGVAAYCLRHRDRIAALVSSDNDFLLLPHGCPVVALTIPRNPNSPITVDHVAPQDEVTRLIGGTDRLPLFAALAGCDYSRCYFEYALKGAPKPPKFTVGALRFPQLEAVRRLVANVFAEVEGHRKRRWVERPIELPLGLGEEQEPITPDGELVAAAEGEEGEEEEEDFMDAAEGPAKDDEDGEEDDEPGPEVMALISEPMKAALDRLARRIVAPNQRQRFLWDACIAYAFFTANSPAHGNWPMLPHPAYSAIPHGFVTITVAKMGDGFIASVPAVRRLALALEYFKARKDVQGADPYLTYTIESCVIPEEFQTVGPAVVAMSPAMRSSGARAQFRATTVTFPDAMHRVCSPDLLRHASPLELLVHLLAPGTTFAADPAIPAPDRVFLLALHFVLRHRIVTLKQLPVVVATYVLSRLRIAIPAEDAYRLQHPTGHRSAQPCRQVYLSYIGLDWTARQVMDRLESKDLGPQSITDLKPHPCGKWQTCFLTYRSDAAAWRAMRCISGRRDLGADCLWGTIPRQQPVPCAKGMVLANAVQPVLHTAYHLNCVLGAFLNVGYEPWLFFNGTTFQMLQLDYGTTLDKWAGQPEVWDYIDRLLTCIENHFPVKGAVQSAYVHECWPYDHRVVMNAPPEEAGTEAAPRKGRGKGRRPLPRGPLLRCLFIALRLSLLLAAALGALLAVGVALALNTPRGSRPTRLPAPAPVA